ncbi:hypothetical protein MMC20_000195 [Loxospora ochrophaea]|nr:hypothetical protein [Loxospora ochrophaea]
MSTRNGYYHEGRPEDDYVDETPDFHSGDPTRNATLRRYERPDRLPGPSPLSNSVSHSQTTLPRPASPALQRPRLYIETSPFANGPSTSESPSTIALAKTDPDPDLVEETSSHDDRLPDESSSGPLHPANEQPPEEPPTQPYLEPSSSQPVPDFSQGHPRSPDTPIELDHSLFQGFSGTGASLAHDLDEPEPEAGLGLRTKFDDSKPIPKPVSRVHPPLHINPIPFQDPSTTAWDIIVESFSTSPKLMAKAAQTLTSRRHTLNTTDRLRLNLSPLLDPAIAGESMHSFTRGAFRNAIQDTAEGIEINEAQIYRAVKDHLPDVTLLVQLKAAYKKASIDRYNLDLTMNKMIKEMEKMQIYFEELGGRLSLKSEEVEDEKWKRERAEQHLEEMDEAMYMLEDTVKCLKEEREDLTDQLQRCKENGETLKQHLEEGDRLPDALEELARYKTHGEKLRRDVDEMKSSVAILQQNVESLKEENEKLKKIIEEREAEQDVTGDQKIRLLRKALKDEQKARRTEYDFRQDEQDSEIKERLELERRMYIEKEEKERLERELRNVELEAEKATAELKEENNRLQSKVEELETQMRNGHIDSQDTVYPKQRDQTSNADRDTFSNKLYGLNGFVWINASEPKGLVLQLLESKRQNSALLQDLQATRFVARRLWESVHTPEAGAGRAEKDRVSTHESDSNWRRPNTIEAALSGSPNVAHELTECRAHSKALRKAIDDNRVIIQESQERVDFLEDEMRMISEEMGRLEVDSERWKSTIPDLSEMHNRLGEYKKQEHWLGKELGKAKEITDQYRKNNEAFGEQLRDTEEIISVLTAQLGSPDSASSTPAVFVTDSSSVKEDHADLEKELEEIKEHVDQSIKKIEDLEREKRNLEDTKKDLTVDLTNVVSVHEENVGLKEDLEVLKEKVDQSLRKIEELESERKDYEDILTQHEVDLDTLEERADGALKDLREERENHQRATDEWAYKRKSLVQEAKHVANELQKCKDQCDFLEQLNDSLTEQVQLLSSKSPFTPKSLASPTKREVDDLQAELAEEKSSHQRTSDQLRRREDSIFRLERELTTLKVASSNQHDHHSLQNEIKILYRHLANEQSLHRHTLYELHVSDDTRRRLDQERLGLIATLSEKRSLQDLERRVDNLSLELANEKQRHLLSRVEFQKLRTAIDEEKRSEDDHRHSAFNPTAVNNDATTKLQHPLTSSSHPPSSSSSSSPSQSQPDPPPPPPPQKPRIHADCVPKPAYRDLRTKFFHARDLIRDTEQQINDLQSQLLDASAAAPATSASRDDDDTTEDSSTPPVKGKAPAGGMRKKKKKKKKEKGRLLGFNERRRLEGKIRRLENDLGFICEEMDAVEEELGGRYRALAAAGRRKRAMVSRDL